jgi:uncharacterized protein
MSLPADRPLDALGLARSGALIEREYPIAGFSRLRDKLIEENGLATARAEFRQRGAVPTAVLEVKAHVVLECQRCFGPVPQDLESLARLAFAREDAPDMPPDYEAIGGDPRRVDLASLVEDELLLSLPLIARHRGGERCVPPTKSAAPRDSKAQEMRRPFAELKKLMKR